MTGFGGRGKEQGLIYEGAYLVGISSCPITGAQRHAVYCKSRPSGRSVWLTAPDKFDF